MGRCYTILSTPYSSLSGVLAANSLDRNAIFGIRFFFAYFTGIIVGAATPYLTDFFGWGDYAVGWQASIGYAANKAQSNASQLGIVLLQTAVLGVFAFVAVIALLFYKLNREKVEQIQQNLNNRVAAA